MLGCGDCGTLQHAPTTSFGAVVCAACRKVLERRSGRSLDACLALSASTFLLLIPANLLTLLSASVLGLTRHSYLVSSVAELWVEGWPLLGVVVGAFVVAAPLVRFGLLTLTLSLLRVGASPPWLGRVFRITQSLSLWAMPDVFLLGFWIAYVRLSASLTMEIGVGGFCFIAAALCALFTRATLNAPAIWNAIQPQATPQTQQPLISCSGCENLARANQEGERCPRCALRLRSRKVNAVGRAMALTGAGLLLYLPANLYTMAIIPIGVTPSGYTVLQGVFDLVKARLYGLATLVFCASFAIPLLKLFGMGWLITSILRRSRRQLTTKARLFRVIEEIGRWSMVDPFTIACFVPVMQINASLYGRAGPAATAFTGVVVTTMVAARLFDPRRLWDAAAGARA